MKEAITLIHCEHVSDRPFQKVVDAFEHAVGVLDSPRLKQIVAASASQGAFEAGIRAAEGPSGFMRLLDIDHGAWMARTGLEAKCRLYIFGNPLIARGMLEHDLAAGLNVPVRAVIYEDRTGKTRFAYDLPSSFMAHLGNPRITAAAKALDEKVAALARDVTGTEA